MRSQDLSDLFLLAALWGSTFLFLQLSASEFGPLGVIAVRTLVAAAILVPLMLFLKKWHHLMRDLKHIVIVGVHGVALPFVLIAYASVSLPSGFLSVLNASAPLWGRGSWPGLWLKDRLSIWRITGLIVGFVGILVLLWSKLTFFQEHTAALLPVMAGLLGPLSYAVSASYTKKHLMHCDPVAASAGSLLVAGLLVLPFAWWTWPDTEISTRAWGAAIILGIACTAISYIIYYRFQLSVGPSKAVTVTFLIPVFAILWGWLWLGEDVTLQMLMGAGVILIGTALATGMWPRKKAASTT